MAYANTIMRRSLKGRPSGYTLSMAAMGICEVFIAWFLRLHKRSISIRRGWIIEKLAAADASFLYSETNKCNSNVASIQILELPEDVSAQEFVQSLKGYMQDRLYLVTYLTKKLQFVPGNLDHPVWIQDTSFDIDNHIIEYPVAAPGSRLELDNAIAALHKQKIPLERPLWAMYVLTGLEGGRVAYYNQVHHATIDGMSGNAMIMTLMDKTPDHLDVEPPSTALSTIGRSASPTSLLEQSFQNFVRFQLEGQKRLFGMMDTSRRMLQRAIDPSKGFGAVAKLTPETPFNTQISEKRAFASGEFLLAEAKQMDKSVYELASIYWKSANDRP